MFDTAYDVFIGFSPFVATLLTIFGFVMLVTSIYADFHLEFTWLIHTVQEGWSDHGDTSGSSL
jgi:hypothetical protein